MTNIPYARLSDGLASYFNPTDGCSDSRNTHHRRDVVYATNVFLRSYKCEGVLDQDY